MLPGRSRHLSRALAGVVALSLGMPTVAFAAEGSAAGVSLHMRLAAPDSEIERLYIEGQDKYANGDFADAADSWTRLLARLPEAQDNKATRENVLLNILQANLDAYNRTRRDDGTKDIEHLRDGKKTLDKYYNDYRKSYGDRASVSAAVQEKGDELEALLEEAEKQAATAPPVTPPVDDPKEEDPKDPVTTGPTKEVIVVKSDSAGSGLIVGGVIAGAVGVGMIGLGIAGGVLGPRAEEEFNNATTQDERDDAEVKGQRANAMLIAGLVVGAVGLISGAVLIVFGVKRRRDSDAAAAGAVGVTPVVGPRFGGLSLSGKF